MANQANIKAVITAEDRASKTIRGVGDSTSKLGAIAAVAAKTGLLALGAASIFSVKAFAEQEKAEAQLNAVLRSTGHAAGVTADEAKKLSQALMQQSTFADEDILAMENLLLTFTKINKKIFPQTTKIALDMSVALGQDLKSSAIQVGKALQDPILGVTALRRVGVNFSDSQREVIKKLVETGKTAKAQQLILKELNTEFGGSAAASAKTFSGQLQQLKNSIGELAEAGGARLVPVLSAITTGVKEITDSLTINKVALSVGEIGYQRYTSAVNSNKAAQELAKQTTKAVTQAQSEYNRMVALFGPHSKEAKKALDQLRQAQLKDAEAKANAKLQQQLLNAAEQFYIKSTPGVSKAIQTRANRLGLVVNQLGAGISNAKQLDRVLLNIKPDAQALSAIVSGLKTGGLKMEARASGGPIREGEPYLVGEKGPEIVVPKNSGTVIPNNKISSGKSNGNNIFNITIQAGAFMGNQQDARKYAVKIVEAYKEAMLMKGQSSGVFA